MVESTATSERRVVRFAEFTAILHDMKVAVAEWVLGRSRDRCCEEAQDGMWVHRQAVPDKQGISSDTYSM